MTKTEYKLLKELDGFLNELRILLYSKYYKPEVDKLSKGLNQTEVQTINDDDNEKLALYLDLIKDDLRH